MKMLAIYLEQNENFPHTRLHLRLKFGIIRVENGFTQRLRTESVEEPQFVWKGVNSADESLCRILERVLVLHCENVH